ncbi:MAG TPA: hypothetical protein PLI30_09680 [Petrimonas sp.]|nr:hypothetical protein [Petrimonas sp.]
MPVQLQSLNLSADRDAWREPDTLWVQRPISRLVCRWSVKPAAGWLKLPKQNRSSLLLPGVHPKLISQPPFLLKAIVLSKPVL